MALNSMICLTSQTWLPRGVRAVAYSREFPSAISTVSFVRRPGPCFQLSLRPFSLNARSTNNDAIAPVSKGIDKKLVRLLEDEIKQTKEEEEDNLVSEIPLHIPFNVIEDNLGEVIVTLTRQYKNESIKVQAYMADEDEDELEDYDQEEEEEEDDDHGEADDDEGDNEGDNDEDEDYEDSSIPMVVSISKENGAVLEFGITTYQDEFVIDSLSIKQEDRSNDGPIEYGGPEFSDLDEDFQEAFYKYLKVRGVDLPTIQFLHEYIEGKKSREYLAWLNNLKNFIES